MTRQKIGFDAIGTAQAFSETQTYQYDFVNRLTQASTPSWTQPNGFDAVGNRWVNVNGLVGLPAAQRPDPDRFNLVHGPEPDLRLDLRRHGQSHWGRRDSGLAR